MSKRSVILLFLVYALVVWGISNYEENYVKDSSKAPELIVIEPHAIDVHNISMTEISVETFFKVINNTCVNRIPELVCHTGDNTFWFTIYDYKEMSSVLIESDYYEDYLTNQSVRTEILTEILEWEQTIQKHKTLDLYDPHSQTNTVK